MVYVLGDEINVEIRAAFKKDASTIDMVRKRSLKSISMNIQKLLIKYLNQKWDVNSFQSHIVKNK